MKKLIFILFLFLFFNIPNNAYSKEGKIKKSIEDKITIAPFDFRGLQWESSIEKVLGKEKLSPKYKSKEKLVYEGVYFDFKSDITYFFNNEKLEKTAYNITKNYSDKTDYVKDFITIEKKLSELYGQPISHNAVEIHFISPERYENFVESILNGDQNLDVIWNYKKTKINLVLKKEHVFFVRFEVNFEKQK